MYWWEHLEVQDDVVILFFLLLTLTPCVYVILSRRWSVPLEDLTSKEKDPHVQVGKSLPLCLEEWIVAFVKSCLLVIAPDFRIHPPPPSFFCFVLPSCAFPSGIVSDTMVVPVYTVKRILLQKIDQRLSHLLSLIMPCECMIYGETPVVFTCWCCLSVGE